MDNSVIGTVLPVPADPRADDPEAVQRAEPLHGNGQSWHGPGTHDRGPDLGDRHGEVLGQRPLCQESLVLLKQLFSSCATKNWSGITGLSGDGVGLPQFESGKAAMTFAVDFGYGTIAASSHFSIGSMPFPEITTATTPLSANVPGAIGQHYRRDELHDPRSHERECSQGIFIVPPVRERPAVRLDVAGRDRGIPAIRGIAPPPSTAGYFESAWGKPEIVSPFASSGYDIAPGVLLTEAYDGYLLGAKTLSQEVSYLEGLFKQGATYLSKNRRLEQPAVGKIPIRLGSRRLATLRRRVQLRRKAAWHERRVRGPGERRAA